jgi:hypothetical protein
VSELADPPGGWREASELGSDASRDAWADAARDVLIEAARHYRSVVAYKELSVEVQRRSGIRTSQLMHYWIGTVLGRVAERCAQLGEPLLSALCVNAQGSVGEGYAVAARAAYGETPADPDEHAAHERLACYRHFGAVDLPADGGTPALTPRLEAARDRRRKTRAAERVAAACPTCHMQLPATGVCDNCA